MGALQEQHSKWSVAQKALGVPNPSPRRIAVDRREPELPPDNVSEFDIPEINRIRWKRIVRETAKQHDMTIPEMLSHRRRRAIVEARQLLFYRLYRETALSLAEIGRRCGGFDHTTVYWAIKRYGQRTGEVTA